MAFLSAPSHIVLANSSFTPTKQSINNSVSTSSTAPQCAAKSPRATRRRRSTASPDPTLLSLTKPISRLHAARKSLRKSLGCEPPIYAAIELLSLPNHDWDSAFDARNEITVTWLWLVAAIARKAHRVYLSSFPEMAAALSLADITQEGVCGLINAVEKWDSTRGYAFDAYAFYMIKHAIMRAIENQARPIRLPVHVLNKLSKMRAIGKQLQSSDGDISIENLAKKTGISVRDANLYLNRSKTLFSLDAPLEKRGDGNSTLHEFLIDTTVDVARQVERVCTREAVAELVNASNLGELERSVLWLKYGLGDGVERVRAEVSRILDVRVEKVRRAELSALKKMRHVMGDDISAWSSLIS